MHFNNMNYNGTPYPITQLTPEQMDRIRMSVKTAKDKEERVMIEVVKLFEDRGSSVKLSKPKG